MGSPAYAPDRIWVNQNMSPIGPVIQSEVQLEPSEVVAQVEFIRADLVEEALTAARAVCEQYPAGDLSQAMIELQKAVKAMEGE